MSELRKDPIVQRWVIIAPDRANRPMQIPRVVQVDESILDPFAEGNEASTPPEVFALRNSGSVPNSPNWRVRVVPNKYPAVQMTESAELQTDGFYQQIVGYGAHEVIIECPHDETNLSRLSITQIREVLSAYQCRMLAVKQDPGLVYASIFKNKGTPSGASLRHSHSQMIATPVVPTAITEEMNGAREYFNERGQSVFHDLIVKELGIGTRIILETPGFVALCPYASRFPFEIWILPKVQRSHFEDAVGEEIVELGRVLKVVLSKLERALGDPPYNYMIHSAPFNQPESPHYLWHMEIFPRLKPVGGFEWGSGVYINHVPPEEAAKILRDTIG